MRLSTKPGSIDLNGITIQDVETSKNSIRGDSMNQSLTFEWDSAFRGLSSE